MLDPRQSVAQVVLEHSECARVFQRHRIDFCCHGERSVAEATDEFSLPAWACNSFRELKALESDIMIHVHLENHVLAPRFAA